MPSETIYRCYIVSYDVRGTGGAGTGNAEIIAAIKERGSWAHITESTWAVRSDETHKELRDRLEQVLPQGSRLFVVRSGSVAAWQNVLCSNEWLKKNL